MNKLIMKTRRAHALFAALQLVAVVVGSGPQPAAARRLQQWYGFGALPFSAALAAGPGGPVSSAFVASAPLQPATYVVSPGGASAASPGAAVAGAAAPPAPTAVYYVPGPGATTCAAVDSFPIGKLCTAQEVVTVVQTGEPSCNEYTAQCSGSSGTKTERRVLRPSGTILSNPGEYMITLGAACQRMGYKTYGVGDSAHTYGDSPASNTRCHNGQGWVTGNYWVKAICCN